ncbi:hypothetical protein [Azospirillum argentinense]|uniref:hypothetical protein n=1 Tax=Azospirillum argentinense TaxID=2970906 RepID=UPI0032DE328C
MIDGEQHFRCPRRPILEDPEGFREVFRVYRAYQKGFLPELGGLEAQAAKLTRALDLIEVTTTQCEEQRQAEDARKRARSGRAPRPRM